MEAGGIEPPSRDGSGNASTCIVDRLNLGSADAGRQASAFPSPTGFSLATGQASVTSQPTGVVARNSGRLPRDGLRVFTQPWHMSSCHVKFFARCLTRPPDNLGTPRFLLLARSNPIAPGFDERTEPSVRIFRSTVSIVGAVTLESKDHPRISALRQRTRYFARIWTRSPPYMTDLRIACTARKATTFEISCPSSTESLCPK